MLPEVPTGAADPLVMAKTFRETMWFKLGDTQVEEGQEQDGDEDAPGATVVMLPIEDRYTGEVTAQDSLAFGLHTGSTEYLRVVSREGLEDDVPMSALVGEMKSRRRMLAFGTGACALVAAFAMYLAG